MTGRGAIARALNHRPLAICALRVHLDSLLLRHRRPSVPAIQAHLGWSGRAAARPWLALSVLGWPGLTPGHDGAWGDRKGAQSPAASDLRASSSLGLPPSPSSPAVSAGDPSTPWLEWPRGRAAMAGPKCSWMAGTDARP